jgi:hypothetical protein
MRSAGRAKPRRGQPLINIDRSTLEAAKPPIIELSHGPHETVYEHGASAQFLYTVDKGALHRFRLMPGDRRSILWDSNSQYNEQSHCETALQRMGRATGWPSLVFRLFGYFAGISGPITHGNSRQLAPQPILSPIRQTTWRSRVDSNYR